MSHDDDCDDDHTDGDPDDSDDYMTTTKMTAR